MSYLGSLLLVSCIVISFHTLKAQNSTSSKQLLQTAQSKIPDHSSAYIVHRGRINRKPLNIIDSCWRLKRHWSSNRQSLADCVVGFGHGSLGGRQGVIYIVTDQSDDPIDPKPGTLRFGVTRDVPLWIIFTRDMVINLKNELMINSYKTIDGRGVHVELAYGPCITIEDAKHVIIHGINIHDCKRGRPGYVKNAPNHHSYRRGCDGDGIKITNSSNVWIDHCYLSNSADGLIDAIHASKDITISNCRFTNHVKVMLLGHRDGYIADKVLRVTVAFNHFGPGLTERMPRLRYGYVHVANNYYEPWLLYAIGGSSNPTILSEANYFVASNDSTHKQVTKRELINGLGEAWQTWRWTSRRDAFRNGAYFIASGRRNGAPPYNRFQRFNVSDASHVPILTSDAGPLRCVINRRC
ncbi:hypothetical protein ACH5RR_017588 [Cinchona calisaya]|uniref:Pectate lyase n=1 Tax=Cinchona calisaya TaxID=153742 RepID=A0ABD2ZJY0_9GENT